MTERVTHGANAPVKVLLQPRFDNARIERVQTRKAFDGIVEMHEALNLTILLLHTDKTVVAVAVDERVCGANIGGAGRPLGGILWDIAEEDQNRGTRVKLELLEADTHSPIIVGRVRDRSIRAGETVTPMVAAFAGGRAAGGTVQFIDLLRNSTLNGIGVGHVKTLELWVDVTKCASVANVI